MPGAGVTDDTVATVCRVTGASEVHGSFKRQLAGGRWVADTAAVARARRRLAGM